jgi:hypothetical protein
LSSIGEWIDGSRSLHVRSRNLIDGFSPTTLVVVFNKLARLATTIIRSVKLTSVRFGYGARPQRIPSTYLQLINKAFPFRRLSADYLKLLHRFSPSGVASETIRTATESDASTVAFYAQILRVRSVM